jgi:hypothetical protein
MHRYGRPLNRAEVCYFRYVTWATNVKPKGLIGQSPALLFRRADGDQGPLLLTFILHKLDSGDESLGCEQN